MKSFNCLSANKCKINYFDPVLGHLSHSGDLLLSWRPSSCVFVNVFFSITTGPILTNLVFSICRAMRQEIVNFVTPNTKER